MTKEPIAAVSTGEAAFRARLAAALPYRPALARALVSDFGSAEAVLSRRPTELYETGRVSPDEAERLLTDAEAFDAQEELARLSAMGGRLVWFGGAGYPARLAEIPDPPALLWVLGGELETTAVAVVGTRRPTPYGRRMASRLADEAARGGLAVVSGGARGIDTVAHEAALAAGGRTWVVLGSGFLKPYPRENRALFERIAASGGAVLSEHPLEAGPMKEHFPRRNRVVSGLAFGTVVVEGDAKSGSLITARCALDQGRDVFAVPGPADSPMSDGPNRLIQQGAKLALSMADVVDELSAWHLPLEGPQQGPAGEADRAVLDAIGPEARAFDEVASSLGWDAARLSEALLDMELRGLVAALPGQRYYRK